MQLLDDTKAQPPSRKIDTMDAWLCQRSSHNYCQVLQRGTKYNKGGWHICDLDLLYENSLQITFLMCQISETDH